MALFDWFKKRPATVSEVLFKESSGGHGLTSDIASTIDGYIEMHGFDDFESDGLNLIVTDQNGVSISASDRFVQGNILVSVPLNELGLTRTGIEAGGGVRHRVVDMAAYAVMRRISQAK
jgi:hypothetical protein